MIFEFTTSTPIGNNDIAIFCRTEGIDKPVRVDLTNPDPYIYVRESEARDAKRMNEVVDVIGGPDSDITFYGIEHQPWNREEKLAKVILIEPDVTPRVRDRFTKTWESDVVYTQRVRIDANIKNTFEVDDAVIKKIGDRHYTVPWDFVDIPDDDPEIPKRNFYYDIEVGGAGFVGPEDDDLEPVTAISGYDSYEKKLYTWTFRSDWETETETRELDIEESADLEDKAVISDELKTVDWEIRRFDGEQKMFSDFIEFFRGRFDVLSSWYGDKFDTPYIINRIEDIGLNPDKLSNVGQVEDGLDRYEQAAIGGVFMNDLKRRYEKIEDPKSAELVSVARDEVGLDWEQHSANIQHLWDNSPEDMLVYNALDVIAMVGIDGVAEVSEFYTEKVYNTGTMGEQIEQASRVIEKYCFFEAYPFEKLPRRERQSGTDIGGAVVFNPQQTGVVENVIAEDLSRIYPSIIRSIGMSYETFVDRDLVKFNQKFEHAGSKGDESWNEVYEPGDTVNPGRMGKEERKDFWNKIYDIRPDGTYDRTIDWEFESQTDVGYRLPNGVRFEKMKHVPEEYQDEYGERVEGIIPRILGKMYDLREQFEDIIAGLDTSAPDYNERKKALLRKRQVEKDNINAVFGAADYDNFRLLQYEMAESITFIGRNLLRACRQIVQDEGYEVIYGDTDSVYIQTGKDDSNEEIHEVGQYLQEVVNDGLDEFANNFCDIEDHEFLIEFESIYKRMFIGDQKKKYAGFKIWDEDGGFLDDPYVDITGFEYVRGDAPTITGKVQKDLFDAILKDGKGKEEAFEIVDRYYAGVRNGEYDPRICTRSPSLGGWQKNGQHAKAARYTKQFFGDDVEINTGDNIYCVYVTDPGYNYYGEKLPDANVIGMTELMDPPLAFGTCECGHEWEEREFSKQIESCPECGSGEIDVSGCYVDWDTISDKFVRKKARRLFKYLGWEDVLARLDNQETFAMYA